MALVYADVAEQVLGKREVSGKDQYWVACSGGPGAGKSTVAAAVAEECRLRGVSAVVLPMDGYHYSREKLRELDPPDASSLMQVRGAPQTFDADKFIEDLFRAKEQGEASLPAYCRSTSDPMDNAVSLKKDDHIVIVEGNYLFLGFLKFAYDRSLRPEAERWSRLCTDEIFDERWFVEPRGGLDEQRRRLIDRHLETWTDAKTKAWQATSPRDGAAKRADFNDVPNAHLVDQTKHFADLHIETIPRGKKTI